MSNLNQIAEYLEVYNGTRTKEEVVAAQKDEISGQLMKIAVKDTHIKIANDTIMTYKKNFMILKESVPVDSPRTEFFEKL